LNFKSSIVGNRLHINGNRLQLLNSNFKTLLKVVFSKLSFGNWLHCLVIDYHSLGCLENTLFWGKAWSWINIEAMLVCWNNLVLILKQCLTFECLLKWSWKQRCLIILWHHQNHVFIHSQSPPFWWWQSLSSEFFSTSSKPTLFTYLGCGWNLL